MLQSRGAIVTGTDQSSSETTAMLGAHSIQVTIGDCAESLPSGTDLVISSAAVASTHPQVQFAVRTGVESISYAQALGWAQAGCTAVSIAGTHGKSTTTALLSHILVETGIDPSVIVGANCPQLGGGTRTGAPTIPIGPRQGEPGVFVAEACEYNRSFHSHQPTMALINNVEEDHLDVYRSLDEIVQAFRVFAGNLPSAHQGGRLLIAHEGAHRRAVASGLTCSVATFGWSPSADYRVDFDPASNSTSVWHGSSELLAWRGHLLGEHNALNGAAAGILAVWLGADRAAVEQALASFTGIDRRMQFLGECTTPSGASVRVFDDYGHHPTECERTLTALRAAENPARLVCVFQPHQHSRTRFLLEQFAQSFSKADLVVVGPIYFVRDSEIERTLVSSQDLAQRLVARGTNAIAIDEFDQIRAHLHADARDGDLIVVMGAGPIWTIAHEFVADCRTAQSAVSMPPRAAAAPQPG